MRFSFESYAYRIMRARQVIRRDVSRNIRVDGELRTFVF